MARQDTDFIAKRQQLVKDGLHEDIKVCSRKVCTSNAPAEQTVTTEDQRMVRHIEANVSRGMAGCKESLQLDRAELNGLRFSGQKAIRCGGFWKNCPRKLQPLLG